MCAVIKMIMILGLLYVSLLVNIVISQQTTTDVCDFSDAFGNVDCRCSSLVSESIIELQQNVIMKLNAELTETGHQQEPLNARDCLDILHHSLTESGVYDIYILEMSANIT